MFKKYKWLFIILLIIIALIAVVIIFSEDESKFIYEITLEEVTDKIEDEETFILFLKQANCEHCKAFTPNFINVLSENNLEAYALDIGTLTDEENEIYEEIFDISGTPTVLFFDEGNESLVKIEGNQTKAKIRSKLKTAGFIEDK